MNRNTKVVIGGIQPGSIAEEAGLEQGDSILSVNGESIADIFDYRFLTANDSIVVEVLKKDGEVWEIEIEKDEYEDLGLNFDIPMIDEAKSCTNKCIFCFIDQLPTGMRKTLYFKDDDSRLSFLSGNYVTLTNMDNDDINRIIRYKMSPVNISVHTTNPELRVFMLNNRFAGDVLKKIKHLTEGGITVNCQIVLCRNINDGKELDSTISDLAGIYPGVESISVVPVGITGHREGLYLLKPFDPSAAEGVVKQVECWQERFLNSFDSRIVYLADEFYIMAGLDLPEYEAYEDFPQIENGVGLVASFKHEFDEFIDGIGYNIAIAEPRFISIATGVSIYGYIKEMALELEKRFENVKVNVFEIKNNFFGENVTVTGLLTGSDIVSQLTGRELGDELLISRTCMKSGEYMFLDDYTVDMLERELDIRVRVVDNSGRDFACAVLGLEV